MAQKPLQPVHIRRPQFGTIPPPAAPGYPSRAPGYQVAANSGTWVADPTLHDGNDVQSTANSGNATGYELVGAVNGQIFVCAKLDFGTNKTVTKIAIVLKREGAPLMVVETSTDDTNWTSVPSMGSLSTGIGSYVVLYSDSGVISRSARYVRYSLQDNASGTGTTARAGIMEVWALDASGVLPVIPYVPPAPPAARVPAALVVNAKQPPFRTTARFLPLPVKTPVATKPSRPVLVVNAKQPVFRTMGRFLALPVKSVPVTKPSRAPLVVHAQQPTFRTLTQFLPLPGKPPVAAKPTRPPLVVNAKQPVFRTTVRFLPLPAPVRPRIRPVLTTSYPRPLPLAGHVAFLPLPIRQAVVVNINRVRPVLKPVSSPPPPPRGHIQLLPVPVKFVPITNINRVRPPMVVLARPIAPPRGDVQFLPLFRRVFPPIYQLPAPVLMVGNQRKHPRLITHAQFLPMLVHVRLRPQRPPMAAETVFPPPRQGSARFLALPPRRLISPIHKRPVLSVKPPLVPQQFLKGSARFLPLSRLSSRRVPKFVQSVYPPPRPVDTAAQFLALPRRTNRTKPALSVHPVLSVHPSAAPPLRGRVFFTPIPRVNRPNTGVVRPVLVVGQDRRTIPRGAGSVRFLPLPAPNHRKTYPMVVPVRSVNPSPTTRVSFGRLVPGGYQQLHKSPPPVMVVRGREAPQRGHVWFGRAALQTKVTPPGMLVLVTSGGYGDTVDQSDNVLRVTTGGYGDPVNYSGGEG